jgi:hypothetical protein
MDIYLQLGHGMKAHSEFLVKNWKSGTYIFSPKNQSLPQMTSLASTINANNGSVLIDPQFYIPRASTGQLRDHSFWPCEYETQSFFNHEGIKKMIECFYNDYILQTNASAFIIPTLFLSSFDDDWQKITDMIIDQANNIIPSTLPKYLTLCISSAILMDETILHEVIDYVSDLPVDGYYIIPEHPSNQYLVENVSWMFNLLDISASLKRLNKKVIVGYSNHQELILGLAKVDAICSGSWLKTRMFPLDDFSRSEEDQNQQYGNNRETWYYCPQSFSEYQLPYLDIAKRVGLLEMMKSDYDTLGIAEILFRGAEPTLVAFGEREAFRYYLNALRNQASEIEYESYQKTKDHLKLMLEAALDLSVYFNDNGINAKSRNFARVAEDTLSVINSFDSIWGLTYQTIWNSI